MANSISSDQPNILVITTHDSGRHFGCYGVDTVRTPHVDQLATEGVKLNKSFTTVPICCASRASMMTGQYPQTHGLMDLCFPPFNWPMHNTQHHLSHLMKRAGYHTCLFGIQHEVKDVTTLGFDEVDEQKSRPNGVAVAERASQWLGSEKARQKPFFMQLGFFETHTPFGFGGATPDDSKGVTIPPYLVEDDVSRQTMAALQGALKQADTAVGVVMHALLEHGLEENTIVVFTTDHGIEVPRAKWHLYDAGVEVATIVRWPKGGVRGGRKLDHLISNIDLVPTLLELLGFDVPEHVEGKSYAAQLRGHHEVKHRDAIFGLYHKTSSRMVRTQRYKLIRHFEAATDFKNVPVRIADVLAKSPISNVQLFDLEADPVELKSLHDSPEHQDILHDLDDRLWCWLEDVNDPILQGPVRSPSFDAASKAYQKWRGVKTDA